MYGGCPTLYEREKLSQKCLKFQKETLIDFQVFHVSVPATMYFVPVLELRDFYGTRALWYFQRATNKA